MAPPSHTPRGAATAASRAAWARGRTLALGLVGALAACRAAPATVRDDAAADVATTDALALDDAPPVDASVADVAESSVDAPPEIFRDVVYYCVDDAGPVDAARESDGALHQPVWSDHELCVRHVMPASNETFVTTDDGAFWGWGDNFDDVFQPSDWRTNDTVIRVRPQRLEGVRDAREMQKEGGECVLWGPPAAGRVSCWGSAVFQTYSIGSGDSWDVWSFPRPMGDVSDVLSLAQNGACIRQGFTYWEYNRSSAWRQFYERSTPIYRYTPPGVFWGPDGIVAQDFASEILDTTPQHIDGIVDLQGTFEHVCLLRRDGHVMCWGHNEYGQTGDGFDHSELCAVTERDPVLGRNVTVQRPCVRRPHEVEGIDQVLQIAVGVIRTCVLRRGGTVWCWGATAPTDEDGLGVLGEGRPPSTRCVAYYIDDHGVRHERPDEAPFCLKRPTRVVGIDDAVDLGMGTAHQCVVRANGQVWCWGINRYGQLGDGTSVSRGVPAPVRWH